MISLITANLGTIIVGLIVWAIVCAIILKMVRDKKKGKSPSGCSGCDGCSGSSDCKPK